MSSLLRNHGARAKPELRGFGRCNDREPGGRHRLQQSTRVLRAVLVTLGVGWLVSTKFERLDLGCIEADFFELILNTRWKALDEMYKIYMLLHRSDLNISAKFRQTFSHFFFRAQAVEEALRKDRDCPAEKETPKFCQDFPEFLLNLAKC